MLQRHSSYSLYQLQWLQHRSCITGIKFPLCTSNKVHLVRVVSFLALILFENKTKQHKTKQKKHKNSSSQDTWPSPSVLTWHSSIRNDICFAQQYFNIQCRTTGNHSGLELCAGFSLLFWLSSLESERLPALEPVRNQLRTHKLH